MESTLSVCRVSAYFFVRTSPLHLIVFFLFIKLSLSFDGNKQSEWSAVMNGML